MTAITGGIQLRAIEAASDAVYSFELTESGLVEQRDTAAIAPLRIGTGNRGTRMAFNTVTSVSFELRE